jgi:hypothetical protein
LENVDVITSTGHSKELMPNPSLIINHRFKDYSGMIFMAFELSMSWYKTFLPTPRHAIN